MTERPLTDRDREPVAIVGIGCRFPGGANSPAAFWDLLCEGVDATRELPADRWETGKFYDPAGAKLGKMSTFRGGFLDRIDEFDAQFFGISPREAIWLDPQQRLLLQAAWEALEDGGQVPERLAGSDTGVFMGGFTLDYQLLQNYGVYSRYELQTHSATGMMMTMLANRLSHFFDFRGPSLTVDTACSGSLVAVHLAAQAIWNGECSVALAGGVNVMIAPNMTIAESKGGFLSADGRCKAFAASANGYARGEGAGVVVLKPLADARRDGDPIYALIRGSAVSQDGHTNGITVPNGASQETAMRAAYQRAGIAPHEVGYIEAHGTGTPVGDPIEAAAIGRVVSDGRAPGDRVLIGSVKTNIGHLEAAAGVAGLIKAALALKHRKIPGQLHFTEPNPAIAFDELKLRVQTRLGDWPATSGQRYAGVNSFGFGGTNAHVVLAEPPAESPADPATGPAAGDRPRDRRYLVPLSARSPEALTAAAGSLADFLSDHPADLTDVGHTCALRRSHHDHRLAVLASTSADVATQLSDFSRGTVVKSVVSGRVPAEGKPKLAFVFSGMGPQWWAMARQLLTTEPVFRAVVDRCDEELRKYTGWSLVDEMLATEEASQMAETKLAQTANFAVQIGLAELWRTWGIEPDGIVGHSTGEVAAQYLSGVLSFQDAVKVNYYRSSLQQRTTGTGRMLAVGLTPETLNQAVADAGPLVSVAAINSPSAVTLSGEASILESMAAQLETFGVFHRFLNVKVPYHSHYMDPLREDLLAGLADLDPASARVPLYSTVTGTRIDGRGVNAHYWWQNVRATVLFAAAFREMLADGYTHFVEISPHPVLASSMKELVTEGRYDALVVPSLRRDEADDVVMLGSLGALYSNGQDVNWDLFYGAEGGHIALPTYPWQLKRYWNESVEAREDRHYTEVHPLLGQRVNASQPAWEREVNARVLPYLADHRIQGTTLVPGAALIEMALAAAREVYGDGCYAVEDLQFRKAVVLPDTADPRLRTTLHQESGQVEIASYTATPSGERSWTVHATAQLGQRMPTPGHRDLDSVRAGCDNGVTREEFYARSRQMGFEYGPAFQAVRSAVSGPRSAVGRVTVPAEIRDDLGAYRFHPALIDAAFQVLLTAATPPTGDGEGQTTPYLPVGVDGITVYGRPVDEMFVVTEVTQADSRVIVSDLAICDPTGAVLAEISGFRAQSLQSASSLSLDRIDRSLYEVSWREAPPEPAAEPAADDPAATWLVFADAGGVGDEVTRQLREAGRPVVTVRAGDVADVARPRAGEYTVNPADADHYRQLVREVAGDTTIGKVVHLWSLDAPFDDDIPVDSVQRGQDLGALSVLNLVQALSAELTHQLAQVWLVTREAQAVPEAPGPIAVSRAPVWGIGRVVGHQEFPSLWGGLVDLGPGADSTQAGLLIDEISAARGEDQVAYRDGRRFVARLEASANLAPPFPIRLRDNGSYLVTGGLGALGLLVARFLVDRGARDIVLMGRTAVPPADTWHELPGDHPQRGLVDQLLALRAGGADVSCVAVDAADEEQLTAWYAAHRRDHRPPIRGVIHTAGVVDDELMVRMSRDSFERVMRPKVRAGWLLHRLFADAPLDFFVLFGSTGSVIASAGQANYAAANAFLDALAHHRRRLGRPALTIGWGPWSVGMVEKLHLEQVYARRGIELITPEAGLQILGRVLSQRPAHLVAITADWATARATSVAGQLPAMFSELGIGRGDDQSAETAVDADAALNAMRQAPEAERLGLLRGHLHEIAAVVLRLDPSEFGDEENLSGLGIDSLMAVEVKQRIDAMLRVDVSVLDLLQGVTVVELAARLLPLLRLDSAGTPEAAEPTGTEPAAAGDGPLDDELEQLLAQATPDEIEALLAELEQDAGANLTGGIDHEHR